MVPDVQRLFRLPLPLDDVALRTLYRRWQIWNDAAERLVLAGGCIFMLGNALLLLSYLGWLALAPVAVVGVVLAVVFGLLKRKDSRLPSGG
jgi:hypothetical protein